MFGPSVKFLTIGNTRENRSQVNLECAVISHTAIGSALRYVYTYSQVLNSPDDHQSRNNYVGHGELCATLVTKINLNLSIARVNLIYVINLSILNKNRFIAAEIET